MSTNFVAFPVPEDRIPDVAVFLYGLSASVPEGLEAHEATTKPEIPVSDEQRNQLLTRVYVESEPPFREMLMLVADREDPTAPLFYADILAASSEWGAKRSVAGAMGAYGRRSQHRYGSYAPFHRGWDHDEWSHFLTMDADVAAFLVELHGQRQLPLTR